MEEIKITEEMELELRNGKGDEVDEKVKSNTKSSTC